MSSSDHAISYDGDDEPPSKRLRSHPPDTVVVVGKGDSQKEFECHSIFLCCASPAYFDSMFASNMKESTTKRICFPDMDPEGWDEVYLFIDYNTRDRANVNQDNVFTLLPWFHLFQMTQHLEECDNVLHPCVPKFSRDEKDNLFHLFGTSLLYGLDHTSSSAWNQIKDTPKLLIDMVKLEDVQEIVTIIMGHDPEFQQFWQYVETDVLQDAISSDSEEEKLSLLQNPLFPILIFEAAQKKRCEHGFTKSKSDTKMLCRVIKNLPRELYSNLPRKKKTDIKVDKHCKNVLRTILWTKRDDLKGVLEIPDDWSNGND